MKLEVVLPSGLFGSAEQFEPLAAASEILVKVQASYKSEFDLPDAVPEVIAIQRLITVARLGIPIEAVWDHNIAEEAMKAPSLFPLLSVLLCLDVKRHAIRDSGGTLTPADVQLSRKMIYQFRPMADMFSDSQVFICADSRGHGRPRSLYNSDGSLVSRSNFETFVERLLSAQIGINAGTAQAVKFSQNVSTIIAELFENTDIHGKQDADGIPFKTNGIRGMLFKRIKLPLKRSIRSDRRTMQIEDAQPLALEISVFDSGIGYYGSYRRAELSSSVTLTEEWAVVHKCLERHYAHDETVSFTKDALQGHTGMGLYEVLRALQFLKGKFEVRSGRTYGFRTFLEGDTQFFLESSASETRPGMPKPVLLDHGLKFVRIPTANEQLVGSSVRVLIPLN